jgi:hypothetical protein
VPMNTSPMARYCRPAPTSPAKLDSSRPLLELLLLEYSFGEEGH